MKNSIAIALLGVAAIAGTAVAQTTAVPNGKVPLREIPGIGSLFGTPSAGPLFGPEMPPRPPLGSTNIARLKLSVLPSPQGEILQLEAVRQSRAAILKKITDVMGVRAVIDPQLERSVEITQTFRGLSWDELLNSVNYGIEMVKSPAGTYFFADKPIEKATYRIPLNFDSQTPDAASLRGQGLYFYDGSPTLELKERDAKPKPQPGWEKREFGGHEFYYIPLPNSVK